MNDYIVCPHCKKSIPLTKAISHELEAANEKKLQEDRKKLFVTFQQKLREAAEKASEEARKKISQEIELKLKDARNESDELQKHNKDLQTQLLETNKLIRQLRTENEQKKLELEKQLATEQEKIRMEERKRSDEEFRLRLGEKDKKLQDALKMNDELKRKLEQGSQQTQGEVLELELENFLKAEFPYDEIRPVAKGVRGADVLQIVKNPMGRVCGSILWESKRTKLWSREWVAKLKEDQRGIKAECAVIVSSVLPVTIKRFGFLEGIWVGEYESIAGIAYALRNQILEIAKFKSTLDGKKDKMEVLYSYLTGTEFIQRVEAIVEAFTTIQDDIEKEKRWFAAKWAKQEKNVRKVIDNTLGMHGDLQSIMGKALTQVKGLEMLPQTINGEERSMF